MPRALLVFALALLAVLWGAHGQVADSYEPNNEMADATNLNINQTISSSISPAQDVDLYKIHLNSSGVLEARLFGVPDKMRGRIDFYGKNFNWITRKDAEKPGNSVLLKIDIANAGWYYFAIADLDGSSNDLSYSLSVSFEPVIDEEPNSEIGDATETRAGEHLTGYIFPAQDGDFYKIFLNSSGILQASLTNVPMSIAGSMKGRIDLYGKNMNWITRVDAVNPGDNVTLNVDIGSPGWYYLGVADLNGGSYNMTYGFQVDYKPVVDQEPNNEIGDATEIQPGNVSKGFIFPAGDGDFYKIYIPAPGLLQASLEDVPKSIKASMKGRIDLYGRNFNWITRKDAERPGDNVLLEADIANAGWYYFGIGDLNGGSYGAAYAFKVIEK
jgi:hypothetical protein